MDGALFQDISLMLIFVLVLSAALYIATLIWVYKDAKQRGMNGLIVVLLVAFIGWPISLLVYILLRPKSYP